MFIYNNGDKMNYVKGNSYFINESSKQKQYNYLNENIDCDVLIIGSGVTGALLSYYFTKENINTVLVDKSRIGHGSTSITTSLLQYELDDIYDYLSENIDKEKIKKSYELGIEALKELSNIIKDIGNNCLYEVKDTLLYTSKKEEIKNIQNEYNFRKEFIDVIYLDENQKLYDFDIKAGVLSKNKGATLNPYLFTHCLLKKSKNLRIYENTEVINIKGNIVYTNYNYQIKAKKIIVATGYNIKLFTNKNIGTKTITYNVVSNKVSIDNNLSKLLIKDLNDPYNYFNVIDNHIIAGGLDIPYKETNYSNKIESKKYNILKQNIINIYKIKDIKINYKYCGVFNQTNDNLGYIGIDKQNKNKWFCLGYGANGILFSILGSIILKDLYLGKVNKNAKYFDFNR